MEAATTPPGAPPAPSAAKRTGSGRSSFDAVVVGGGHNGLTAAAYLARAGLEVCVLERREILGGACVTEEVWPGKRVSRASYVVSMLQPKVVNDLDLARHGYRAIPLDPAYVALTEQGPIFFHNDAAGTAASIAKQSLADAEAYEPFEELMFRAAAFVRPMMLKAPPAPGSKAPADIAALLREAGRIGGMSKREVAELVRMFTLSVGDLLDDYFELDGLKGSMASTGVVGVWAGPRTPGTAYNLLHHALGELDGIEGAWGQVIGGMGAISEAIAASAETAGAEIRTGAEVASIDVRDGRTVGVTLASGDTITAPIVASGAHPKTTVLDLAGAEHFPEEVAGDMRRYRTRGGSVKINMVLSEPPRYENVTATEQEMMMSAGVNLCPSIDYLERAWQDATLGKPAENPYVEAELPSHVDSTLTDDGSYVMTMFTQYGPPGEEAWGDGARERYADACIEHLGRYAPNVPGAIVEREVLAPPDLERIFGLVDGSIFQGEQDLAQMAFMRPVPQLAQYATPVHGLYLCGAGTHPGGGVMAASGHNAAQRILKDRRSLRSRLRSRAAF
ncbi:MAG TPA: NAD(P)/FAD-dependent oxidoreductase [Solirubrobacterales bacterium]|jgi:phytoene dehydrogenase-like protein|nr:NAD(P)/FAD-dependent oxidoreductase [Solirubrobacterales bacterium]